MCNNFYTQITKTTLVLSLFNNKKLMQIGKKIIIVVGTRPNFIKITQFEKVFALYPNDFELKIVHTGQHYDYNMSDVFFKQLKIKTPDYFLNIKQETPTHQIGATIIAFEKVLLDYKPDLVIVVGDVNSTFAAAFVAYKMNIKIAHLESGLRSNDRTMPEEINRILTDEIANYFFVTEQSGVDNLKKNGKTDDAIFFVGNTMIDTLMAFEQEVKNCQIMEKFNLLPNNFALVTLHRPSNVDIAENLELSVELIAQISKLLPVVFPVHPRTYSKLIGYGLEKALIENKNIQLCEPLDYLSFQKLIKDCSFVLTDSGGVQEETTFRQVPCLTLRNNTERPVTISVGSNELIEFEIDKIIKKVKEIISGRFKKGSIPELWDGNATERIVKTLFKIDL